MSGTLRLRLARGFGAQSISQIVVILVQALGVPVFLYGWGLSLYGEWLILAAIPIYLSLIGQGLVTAFTHDMVMRAGAGDHGAAAQLFHTVLAVTLAAAGLLAILVALAAFFLPLSQWFGFSVLGPSAAALVLVALVAFDGAGVWMAVLYGAFSAARKYDIGTLYMTGVRGVEFAVLALAVLLGAPPSLAAMAYMAARFAGVLVMALCLRRHVPWLSLMGPPRISLLGPLLRPGFSFLAFPLGNALNLQGVVLALGAVTGPAAVAVFSTLRTLTRFALQLVRSVNQTVRPEIAAAFGANDAALLKKLSRFSVRLGLWLALAAALGLLFLGAPLLHLWTGGTVPMRYDLFALFLAVVVLNAAWWSGIMIFFATNRHHLVAWLYAGAGLLTVLAVYGAAHIFGLVGAAAVLVLAELAMLVLTVPRSIALAGDRRGAFLAHVLVPPLGELRGVLSALGGRREGGG